MRLSPTENVEFVRGVAQEASVQRKDSVEIPNIEMQLSSEGLHPSVIYGSMFTANVVVF